MVADIRLLQGKLIENPDEVGTTQPGLVPKFIEELALEILSDEELVAAVTPGAESPNRGARA